MTSAMTFLHAPLHAPETAPDYKQLAARVRAIGATSVAHSEAYPIITQLGRVKGRRLVMEHGAGDTRRGQKDVPILVDDTLRSFGSGQLFGCDAATPDRIAPERWMTYSATERPGHKSPVVHATMHPHAAVQNRKTGKPLAASNSRVKKYAEQMVRFDAMLTFFEVMGWDVVVTADTNWRDTERWASSPHDIMRHHGLTVFSKGLDAIGSSKTLGLHVEVIDGVATDHPWLLGTCSK